MQLHYHTFHVGVSGCCSACKLFQPRLIRGRKRILFRHYIQRRPKQPSTSEKMAGMLHSYKENKKLGPFIRAHLSIRFANIKPELRLKLPGRKELHWAAKAACMACQAALGWCMHHQPCAGCTCAACSWLAHAPPVVRRLHMRCLLLLPACCICCRCGPS